MVLLCLGRTGHDHLGRRGTPDRGLVPRAVEGHGGAGLAHDNAGLVGPMVPGAAHGEEPLVPDHLLDELEADGQEALEHVEGVRAGIPHVAHLERGHEGERRTPVGPGVARERRIAVARASPTCAADAGISGYSTSACATSSGRV